MDATHVRLYVWSWPVDLDQLARLGASYFHSEFPGSSSFETSRFMTSRFASCITKRRDKCHFHHASSCFVVLYKATLRWVQTTRMRQNTDRRSDGKIIDDHHPSLLTCHPTEWMSNDQRCHVIRLISLSLLVSLTTHWSAYSNTQLYRYINVYERVQCHSSMTSWTKPLLLETGPTRPWSIPWQWHSTRTIYLSHLLLAVLDFIISATPSTHN